MKLLDAIDSGIYTHELGLSFYHDYTMEEFRQYMGLHEIPTKVHKRYPYMELQAGDVDWEAQGKVAPVKNQGACGSCWAFSAIGSVETCNAIKTGSLMQFSEQELVDCSGSFGNDGCDGGWMDSAFDYIIANGIAAESDYKYYARDMKCSKDKYTRYHPINGYYDVPENDNEKLYAALSVSTISVAVDAEDSAFYFYKGGIIMKCGTDLDHGVLIVASGTDGSTNYWKIKNSWGASWGEAGHVRIKRDTTKGPGVCGIALSASYPFKN